MAQTHTPEESARRMLAVLKKLNTEPGEAAAPNSFADAFSTGGFEADDFSIGWDFGIAKGWMEESELGSVKLTQLGYAEMMKP